MLWFAFYMRLKSENIFIIFHFFKKVVWSLRVKGPGEKFEKCSNRKTIGKIRWNTSKYAFINWFEINFQFSLTLRARKTPLGAYMGHLQNDVIEAVFLVRMKNGWHNHLSVLNFLSFCVDRVFINALVRLLYAFKIRKYFHNFSLF